MSEEGKSVEEMQKEVELELFAKEVILIVADKMIHEPTLNPYDSAENSVPEVVAKLKEFCERCPYNDKS